MCLCTYIYICVCVCVWTQTYYVGILYVSYVGTGLCGYVDISYDVGLVFVCEYICVLRVYIHTHTHTHIHAYIYIYIHTYIYIYIYIMCRSIVCMDTYISCGLSRCCPNWGTCTPGATYQWLKGYERKQ